MGVRRKDGLDLDAKQTEQWDGRTEYRQGGGGRNGRKETRMTGTRERQQARAEEHGGREGRKEGRTEARKEGRKEDGNE